MVTTGAMPVSPSCLRRPAHEGAGACRLSAWRPCALRREIDSRGPVKGALRGASAGITLERDLLARAGRAASGRANSAAGTAHAHAGQLAGRDVSLHAQHASRCPGVTPGSRPTPRAGPAVSVRLLAIGACQADQARGWA